jgi:hypothetical protein
LYIIAHTEFVPVSLPDPSKNIDRLYVERTFEQVVKEAIDAIAVLGHINAGQSVLHGLYVWGRRCSWNEVHVSRVIEQVSKHGVRVSKRFGLMAAAKPSERPSLVKTPMWNPPLYYLIRIATQWMRGYVEQRDVLF